MGESRFTSEKSATRAIDSLIPRGARWNGTALPCRASPWKVQDNYRAALRAYYYQEAYDIASRGADSRHHRMINESPTFSFPTGVFTRNTRIGESVSSKLGRLRTESDYRESFAFDVAKKGRGTVRHRGRGHRGVKVRLSVMSYWKCKNKGHRNRGSAERSMARSALADAISSGTSP